MSRKNTREIELAFSKHRDPDWEADVEIYGKRVLKTVRGICLGDEWTEIDSLKNKDWIELSDMFGNFDNHNPYFNLVSHRNSFCFQRRSCLLQQCFRLYNLLFGCHNRK